MRMKSDFFPRTTEGIRQIPAGIQPRLDLVTRNRYNPATFLRDGGRPGELNLTALRRGLSRAEPSESLLSPHLADPEQRHPIARYPLVALRRATDERNYVAIPKTSIPCPIWLVLSMGHRNFQAALSPGLKANTCLQAKEIRHAKPFDLGLPNLVAHRAAFKLDDAEAPLAEKSGDSTNPDCPDANIAEELSIALETQLGCPCLRQRSGHEFGQRDPQGPSEILDVHERDVPLASLHAADVGSVQPGPFGKFLLRNAALQANLPEFMPEADRYVAQVHALRCVLVGDHR